VLTPTKATKRQILAYIRAEMWVETWQVADRFNYSLVRAKFRLYALRKEGLVENRAAKDKWNLTETGYRRLEYFERKEKTKTSGCKMQGSFQPVTEEIEYRITAHRRHLHQLTGESENNENGKNTRT
jgi:hypothetical protein